jgi:N5-(cytidine 5'-diphosphoramidyl)-L-glutamine hydrolase
MKIAITQRVDKIDEYNETRDSLDQRWWKLLGVCNLTPIVFPNDLSLTYKILRHTQIDGIILTGGNQTRERLEVESLLIEFAIKNYLPVLGVCNGMQVIQNYFGVPLIKISNHIQQEQEILIDGMPAIVNSYHDFGSVETIKELEVWARAYDGVIKAIKHTRHPITGIMWHPERASPFLERDIHLIKSIFNRIPA